MLAFDERIGRKGEVWINVTYFKTVNKIVQFKLCLTIATHRLISELGHGSSELHFRPIWNIRMSSCGVIRNESQRIPIHWNTKAKARRNKRKNVTENEFEMITTTPTVTTIRSNKFIHNLLRHAFIFLDFFIYKGKWKTLCKSARWIHVKWIGKRIFLFARNFIAGW